LNPGASEAEAVLRDADIVHAPEQVTLAFETMGRTISGALRGRNPLVLAVMLGGMIPTARLLSRLDFPLDIDYVHATRYRGATRGRDLVWLARPTTPLDDRVVLVVDDIFDEGLTLAAILDDCRARGAAEVLSAVLVDKAHERKAALKRADFTGLTVPDRYVFGCGMDYHGHFRNLRGIYAVKGL
jgi:hypoxanthine phosphoribosyltransferase